MDAPTRRTRRCIRRRSGARPSVEVLQLLPRPQRPLKPASAPPAAPAPPELDQLAAVARELGRWWV